ncbi:MAG: hypothetical protein HQL49_05330 [Gammaproteobacteria bacterium]|nr:hypothetical protein [Gammaproteobacteria bacterium]
MKRYPPRNLPLRPLALAVIANLLLHGCGGDSGDSGGGTAAATVSLSGTLIADAPIEAAKVCVDRNSNQRCDSDEPNSLTDSNGQFKIEPATSDDEVNKPLVAEVGVALSGNLLAKLSLLKSGYTLIENRVVLSTPAGYRLISPQTTLVHVHQGANNLTLSAAESEVLQLEGLVSYGVSLFDNYLTMSGEGYRIMSNIAQVATRIFDSNQGPLEQSADLQYSVKNVVEAVVKKVLEKMPEIAPLALRADFSITAAETVTVINGSTIDANQMNDSTPQPVTDPTTDPVTDPTTDHSGTVPVSAFAGRWDVTDRGGEKYWVFTESGAITEYSVEFINGSQCYLVEPQGSLTSLGGSLYSIAGNQADIILNGDTMSVTAAFGISNTYSRVSSDTGALSPSCQ